jgi:threonine dehydratase
MDGGRLSFSSIVEAARVLQGVADITPVMTSNQLDVMIKGQVFLKCENLQRTGAFKFRGAYHALSKLQATASRVVTTISSGNHGQGLALSASLLGLNARVVMPKPISTRKYTAILGYGARVDVAESRVLAELRLRKVIEQDAALYVHAFNDPHVIAGQGTILLEFLDQVKHLDVLLAPVGGGGLVSGSCIAGHHVQPTLEIFACEPEGALDVQQSIELNQIVSMSAPHTIADGLRTSLGSKALPILLEHLAGVFSVSEEEIRLAMRFAIEHLDLVIEPSSAVALAPLLRYQPELIGRRVGVIITGGNIDLPEEGRR